MDSGLMVCSVVLGPKCSKVVKLEKDSLRMTFWTDLELADIQMATIITDSGLVGKEMVTEF